MRAPAPKTVTSSPTAACGHAATTRVTEADVLHAHAAAPVDDESARLRERGRKSVERSDAERHRVLADVRHRRAERGDRADAEVGLAGPAG